MMRSKLHLAILVAGWLVLACQVTSRAPMSATSSPSPTWAPSITPTPTPLPTPTPTPTPLPEVRVATGDRAIFLGDWEVALAGYGNALEFATSPDTRAAAALGIARAHYFSGDYATALNDLRSLVNDYPGTPSTAGAYFTLAQTFTRLNRFSEAAEAYQAYLFLKPGLIDHYIQELRGDALRSAADLADAIGAYQAALEAPSIRDDVLVKTKIATTYAASGDFETALVLYDEIYNETGNDATRAQMDLLSGRAYLALGQVDQAYAEFIHAVDNYPLSYDAYTALVALVEAGVPVDEFQRGLVDYYADQYGVAIAAFDRYLGSGEGDQAGAARYFRGLALRALQDYFGALEQWDFLIQNHPGDAYWDDAWEQKAFTQWAYLDQYSQATQTLLDFVAVVPDHPRAAEYLYDAARIAERTGDLTQAATLWEQVASAYPASENAFKSLFLSGITRFRLGDYPTAQGLFQRALEQSRTAGDQAASHFWIGKCESAVGEASAARGAWERAVIADPTGYYSERARDILLERGPFEPPLAYDLAVDRQAELIQAHAWLRTTFGLPADTDLNGLGPLSDDPRLQRGTELWHLGLYEQARLEFENLRLSVQADPVGTFRLANYLVDLGLYRSAIFAARHVLDLAGLDDASTLTAPRYFNHIRFGTYFSDLVLPIAQAYDFHPLLIFSVIRQESLFEGFIRSSAGARGLMQIIPSTGQSIYELNGWPPGYQADDLYRPKVNVTFGVDYLDDQRRVFDEDLYAALAAYNGGPGNSNVWKNLAPDDPDLFLEVVRFDETQRYIRGIYEIYSIYRRIYDRTP